MHIKSSSYQSSLRAISGYEDDVSSALMSDRAPVMKACDRNLDAVRKDLLQTDENLAFLHCNAPFFLLGLISGISKVGNVMDRNGWCINRNDSSRPGLS